MHITQIRPSYWPGTPIASAILPSGAFPFDRPAQLTVRELRRLVAEMID